MFGSEILEIAISLVFVYLVCSLVATTIREAIEGIIKTRAVQLERGIRLILDDPEGTGYTQKIYDHPLLYSLFLGNYSPGDLTKFIFPWRRGAEGKRQNLRTNLPAYIPSGNFALALMHTVSETVGTGGPLSMQSFTDGAMLLPEGRLKRAMLIALGEAKGDLDRARKSVETWFDGTMDRVSGWYKRETSYILFAIGLVTAVVLNVDTVAIVRSLTINNALRQQLVAHVETAYPGLSPAEGRPTEAQIDAEVTGLSNLIGWPALAAAHRADLERHAEQDRALRQLVPAERAKWVDAKMESSGGWWAYWLRRIPVILIGWVVSALAISLGAPFWFDLLNKLMVIRSTVKPYEKSPPEASADRGAAAKADPLAPAETGDGPARDAAPAAPTPAPAGPVPPPAAAPSATFRVAVDGADAGTAKIGWMVPVPDSGFVELQVPVGANRTISAVGTSGGRPVSWSSDVRDVSLDDEQASVAAALK